MNCATVQTRLTALLDAELSTRVAAQVRAHLATCPDCAQALEEERRLRAQVVVWAVEGGDVWNRVRGDIQAQSDRETVVEVLADMHRLQAEVRALRGEVALLRTHLRTRREEEASGPSPLLPYAPAVRATSVLV